MSIERTALECARGRAAEPMFACLPLASLSSAERPDLSADQHKDQMYLLPHGLIYTSPWISAKPTARSSACILLTAHRQPFEVSFGKHGFAHTAIAVRPLQERGLRAENRAIISIHVHPTHPEYRRFSGIAEPGYQPLDRDAFSDVDELLRAAYAGELTTEQAAQLIEAVVAITVRHLPRVRVQDERSERLLELLQANPQCRISELAVALGVSCSRMLQLFTRAVGLPWRSYQLWQKVRTVGVRLSNGGKRLTEIAINAGFADSAHLSNAWNHAYGAAPSKFFSNELVQLHFGLMTATARPARQARACPHCGAELDT